MNQVESVCRRCDKSWPHACRCEDGGISKPVGWIPRGPGVEHLTFETLFNYRGRTYRARGTYAIIGRASRPAWPKPDVLEVFSQTAEGWEPIFKPSMTLRIKATSDLNLELDMELRRRNPSWHDRLFDARREEQG